MFIPITRPSWIASGMLVLGLVLIGFAAWFGLETVLLTLDGGHTIGTVVAKRIDPNYFGSSSSSGPASAQRSNVVAMCFWWDFSMERATSARSRDTYQRVSPRAREA